MGSPSNPLGRDRLGTASPRRSAATLQSSRLSTRSGRDRGGQSKSMQILLLSGVGAGRMFKLEERSRIVPVM